MKSIKSVFLTAVLILSVLFMVSCHENNKTETPKTTPAASESAVKTPVTSVTGTPDTVTATQTKTSKPIETATPVQTVVPTITTETPEPTVTATATQTVEPPLVIKTPSGSFVSDTGTYLNLECLWTLKKISQTDNYLFEADINITSYSLYVTARNTGIMKFGSFQKNFATPDIKIDPEAGFQHTYITTYTVVLNKQQVKEGLDAFVSWSFYGMYSGIAIDTIEISDSISFI